MIGDDFKAIKKCFDLKGSLFNRETDITSSEVDTGETGFKVLTDKNMID